MADFLFPKSHDHSSYFGEQTSGLKECALLDLWQYFMSNEHIIQFCALCACTVLVAYMLTEMMELDTSAEPFVGGPSYGYAVFNGPHTWKENFPEARVVLQGKWPEEPPTIQGCHGAVDGIYKFQAAFFRWGMSDNEGSEHSVNFMAYPMELQVLHARTKQLPPPSPSLLMISYFFELTDVDNPYLDHVIMGLKHIALPGNSLNVQPFPLMWLVPPFHDQYFAYDGSLSFPPCSESVRWIVRPVSLGISTRQTEQFRQLLGWDGPLASNLRPVQQINNRDILFYPPCKPCKCVKEVHDCENSSGRPGCTCSHDS